MLVLGIIIDFEIGLIKDYFIWIRQKTEWKIRKNFSHLALWIELLRPLLFYVIYIITASTSSIFESFRIFVSTQFF